jgi:hypothetical protein
MVKVWALVHMTTLKLEILCINFAQVLEQNEIRPNPSKTVWKKHYLNLLFTQLIRIVPYPSLGGVHITLLLSTS